MSVGPRGDGLLHRNRIAQTVLLPQRPEGFRPTAWIPTDLVARFYDQFAGCSSERRRSDSDCASRKRFDLEAPSVPKWRNSEQHRSRNEPAKFPRLRRWRAMVDHR